MTNKKTWETPKLTKHTLQEVLQTQGNENYDNGSDDSTS